MQTTVSLAADRLVVEHLELTDPDLVRFVAERAEGRIARSSSSAL